MREGKKQDHEIKRIKDRKKLRKYEYWKRKNTVPSRRHINKSEAQSLKKDRNSDRLKTKLEWIKKNRTK